MRAFISFLAGLLFLFGNSITVNAQQLSLDQLTTLCDQEIDQVNDYLMNRGWIFDDAAQAEDDSEAHASWAFNKTRNYYDSDNVKAQAWLNINNPGPDQLLLYQTSNKLHYDALRARISAYKMEKLGSAIQKGGISTTYVGANFIVSTSVHTSEDNQRAVYLVQVQRREAYLRQLTNSVSDEENSEETEDNQ